MKAQAKDRTFFLARFFTAILWIYQGLIPKLIFRDEQEIYVLENAFPFDVNSILLLQIVGCLEILFGIGFLLVLKKQMDILNICILLFLIIGAMIKMPETLHLAFNPFSLNVAMIALSAIALVNLPSNKIP